MRFEWTPRQWQREAHAEWATDKRGIVAAVTGSGKTALALLCMRTFLNGDTNAGIIIVTPTVALADQWLVTLTEDAAIPPEEVGSAGGGRADWRGRRFVICVINTARRLTREASALRPTMLVVDECHRAGSPQNARALRGKFKAALGLSATPERQYDRGFETFVQPVLGDVVYRYDYVRARQDGVIAPFHLVNVEFPLTAAEQSAYDELTRRIAALSDSETVSQTLLEALLRKRARISWLSRLRVPLAVKLALDHRNDRSILFFESMKQASEAHSLLRARAVRATLYHTGLGALTRQQNLRLYRRGHYTCMVCCRALDEGLDIPDTAVGIIASGSASNRQRIQRLGRVLRAAEGKNEATVYTLFGTEVERRRLLEEAARLEGVSRTSWRRIATHGCRNG